MSVELRKNIEALIQKFNPNKLFDSSIDFFKVLNYPLDTIQEESNYNLEDFLEITGHSGENKLQNYGIQNIEILFSLSEDEMSKKIGNFFAGKVENAVIEAYLFLAVRLDRNIYSKTELVNISKGINKLLNSPAFILFTYDDKITLSVTDRRISLKDEDKDVLEKTTLIKDIDIKKPHSAHLRILSELEFENLGNKQNFSYFHNSLKKVLNTKELNKKFYKEISNWYFWANEVVKFPTDLLDKEGKQISQEKSNSENTIRFITRMIFVWFLKEKNLIQENIFDKDYIYKNIIKEGADKTGSTYYKAILQNLFFGTLNTEMNKDIEGNRTFISHSGNKSEEYGIHTFYRYKRFLQNEDENLIINLFNDIPFLNGGLFECLDHTTNRKKDEIRVDMFSDNPKNEDKLIFPDELLFGKEKDYDLNKVYFTSKKSYKVRGLFEILNDYKFTVEENTPLEEEVALDPELLGEIFENLLASYNEETSTTARKQTGSFYTPREIVNYMVDSSVKEYLKTNLPFVTDDKLNLLFSIDNPINNFNLVETKELIKALDKIKILDPACGSGAFPMGILNRLVKLLEVLDPENIYWKTLRINEAQLKNNAEEMLKEIKQVFDMDKYTANYSRKLFLIENSIYGLDIQPMAIQITKLRFFISLVIEQNIDESKPNNGILTLPNLETKFLSVNSLVGLNISETHWSSLKITNYEKLTKDLNEVSHNLFFVRSTKEKQKYRKKYGELREKIRNLLLEYNWDEVNVEKIFSWNPYLQNAVSDFFDMDFMFDLRDDNKKKTKFDIVIGNPPYVRHEKIKDLKPLIKEQYKTFTGTADIYIYFYELGYNVLKDGGLLSYITSNKWTRAKYGQSFREFILNNTDLVSYIDFNGVKVFESATVDTSILEFKKVNTNKDFIYCDIDSDYKTNMDLLKYVDKNGFEYKKEDLSGEGFTFANPKELKIKKRIEEIGTPLKDWDIQIYRGVLTGFNEAFIIDEKIKDDLIAKDPKCAEIIKPVLRGKDIKRYTSNFSHLYLINTHNGYLNNLRIDVENEYPALKEYLDTFKERIIARYDQGETPYNLRNCAYIDEFYKEKIIYQEMVQFSSFAYDKENYFCLDTGRIITGGNLKFLLIILNSKLFFFSIKKYYGGGGLGETGIRMKHTFFEKFSAVLPSNLELFEKFSDILIYSKRNLLSIFTYLERIVNFMIYGLYFKDEMIKDSSYINDEVEKVLIKHNFSNFEYLSDEAKEKLITEIYEELNSNKVILKALTFCNVEEVKIIEESVQTSDSVVEELEEDED